MPKAAKKNGQKAPSKGVKKSKVTKAALQHHYRLKDNTAVCVYYVDRKQWYTGRIMGYRAKPTPSYFIEWEDPEEPQTWVSLDEKQHTTVARADSWCFTEERGALFRPREVEEDIASVDEEKVVQWNGEPREICVWSEEKKTWVEGTLIDIKCEDDVSLYQVCWKETQVEDWLPLKAENQTRDETNKERWCLAEELKGKVLPSSVPDGQDRVEPLEEKKPTKKTPSKKEKK